VPVLPRTALAALIAVAGFALGCGAGGEPAGNAGGAPQTFTGPQRAVTTEAPATRIVTDAHGCGYGARWDAARKRCHLRPAGPARGLTGHGSPRLARAPLVALVPPEAAGDAPTFWIYLRLSQPLTHLMDTSVDGSRHDLDTPLGIDRESKDKHCVGVAFDDAQPPLRNRRPGQRVSVGIRIGDRVTWTAPTRIRLALSRDFFSTSDPWFTALGCQA
jgi:hypothetical protein